MTSGEKRVARRLQELLENDYLVWYDTPIGRKQRYPDFIILHPSRGLLFLEVKDWKLDTLKEINRSDVTLLTPTGLTVKPHPLEQVRQYTYEVIALLSKDPNLLHQDGPHRGNLIMPYGWGVVFTNISRKQMSNALTEEGRDSLLPEHLVMYREDIAERIDAESFQERLWNMFPYHFRTTLSLPEIEHIRWHLFPEVRIDAGIQTTLLADDTDSEAQTLPEVIRIMDIQQEQLGPQPGRRPPRYSRRCGFRQDPDPGLSLRPYGWPYP